MSSEGRRGRKAAAFLVAKAKQRVRKGIDYAGDDFTSPFRPCGTSRHLRILMQLNQRKLSPPYLSN